MELLCKDKIERDNFISVKIVFFSSSVTYKIEEQLEESSLIATFVFFAENSVENTYNCLNSVI